MKKLFVLALVLSVSVNLIAQTNPAKPRTATPPKPKTATPAKPPVVVKKVVLKNLLDSASYLIGLGQANFFKQQGVTHFNTSLITKGCSEASENNPGLFDKEKSNNVMNRFLNQLQEDKIKLDSGQNVARPVVKPANNPKPTFASLNDSASYIIGFDVASFYKQYDVPKLNAALFAKGFDDVIGNKPTLLNENITNDVLNKLISQMQEEKAKVNIDAGNSFLAKNKLRPEIKVTASGLQYEVITEGTGIKPAAVDTFVCHYRGTLIDGTEFDASYNRGVPLTMAVNQVIRGWTEGLQLMSAGSKYKFYIPYTLGYGAFGNGDIPGGAALIFEVELLDVKKMAPTN